MLLSVLFYCLIEHELQGGRNHTVFAWLSTGSLVPNSVGFIVGAQ